MTKPIFDVLSVIDVNSKIEQRGGLTYLSWAWAWGAVKKVYPSANYQVVRFDGKPYLFDEQLGYIVETVVTIDGESIGMLLPVLDGANNALKAHSYTYKVKDKGKLVEKSVEPCNMFDINKAIMRCLTKNLAMFGLAHYIYAKEDLPPLDAVPTVPGLTPAQCIDIKCYCDDNNINLQTYILDSAGVERLEDIASESYERIMGYLEDLVTATAP